MNEPLAQRLRPKTLADVCGQQHLLAPGRVFRRTIESGRMTKDLALITSLNDVQVCNSLEFIQEIRKTFETV